MKKIQRSDVLALAGLVLAIVTMALPLQSEARALAAGTAITPTVWRFVDLLAEHYPAIDNNGDTKWLIANGLSVALPMLAYGYLAWSGQEIFSWEGLGESFLVGAGIAMGADRIHRKAERDEETKESELKVANRMLHVEGKEQDI